MKEGNVTIKEEVTEKKRFDDAILLTLKKEERARDQDCKCGLQNPKKG